MKTVIKIKQTCYACPSQWEGMTDDGKDVYIRFRWGSLRLDIDGKTVAEMNVGDDDINGFIDLSQARDCLKEHVTITPEALKEYNEEVS